MIVRRGATWENNELRLAKALAIEKEINSDIRYAVEFNDSEIRLTATESRVNTLKFYKFSSGYLKMVFKHEDIPDYFRNKVSGKMNLQFEKTDSQLILKI